LCSCGGGKKFKKCCINKAEDNSKVSSSGNKPVFEIADFSWRKIRQTEGEIIDNFLLPYINKLKPRIIESAFRDFISDLEVPSSKETEAIWDNGFIPWLLFNWLPVKDINIGNDYLEQGKPIAIQYLEKNPDNLSKYQQKFIKAICNAHYSFYKVIEVVRDRSVTLKDLMLDKEITVKEKQGTYYLKSGAIIYTRILGLEGENISVGMLPYGVNADHGVDIVKLRQELESKIKDKKLTSELLHSKFGWIIRKSYFTWVFNSFHAPKMQNTDGEEICICKVNFKLNISLEEAFEELFPLMLENDPECKQDIIEQSVRNKKGEIIEISFPWCKPGNKLHKEWNNTVLGEIIIKRRSNSSIDVNDNMLMIEVNSYERAKLAEKIVMKSLKGKVNFQNILIEDINQKLASSKLNPKKKDELESLKDIPEIQAKLKEMAQKHWQEWLNYPLPALDGKSPMEASRTAKGRELLEALLESFEYSITDKSNQVFHPNVAELRKKLELV
jgi:hypothetical protein